MKGKIAQRWYYDRVGPALRDAFDVFAEQTGRKYDFIMPYFLDDAEFVIVGFGTAGRVALSAVRQARQKGIKVGLLRPITVSPFPFEVIEQLIGRVSGFLVTEMNSGQMLEDVRLAVQGRAPVEFYGRMGGVVPFTEELLHEIERIASSKLSVDVNPRDAWLERMAMPRFVPAQEGTIRT